MVQFNVEISLGVAIWNFLDKTSDIFPCRTELVLGAQYNAGHHIMFVITAEIIAMQ
jgi:hypothetical protein